jgi:hypothetical protein
MVKALEPDATDDEIWEELAQVFWEYIQAPANSQSKAAFAQALRHGNKGVGIASGVVIGSTAMQIKTTRAYGDG